MHSGHNKSHIRLTKFPTDTPPGIGDRFIVPVSLHCQIRIFTSSNTHIHFIANAFSHHQIRIFVSSQTHFHIIKYAYSFHRKHISVRHFVDIYGYEGTINRSPTAANGLPTTLLANWNNMANTPQNIHIQPRNACDQFATT